MLETVLNVVVEINGWFEDVMPVTKKAVVISNCQCLPISSWLTTYAADMSFDFWGVHLIQPSERQSAINDFTARAKSEYDLIITIPLSDEFFDLAVDNIKTTFAGTPVVVISNLYFSGLHPDLTYIGGLSERVVGPLIDYHSRLALFGFLKGRSVEDTYGLYCDETYEKIGYYNEYSLSLSELRNRDQKVDVKVSDVIEDHLKKSICFFSVNHPTPALLAPYCNDVMHYLAGRGWGRHSGLPSDPSLCAESLADNVIFPIYPEIAARHDIPHQGSYVFKEVGRRINPIGLRDFIVAEYQVFEEVGAATLATSHVAQEIAVRFAVL